MIEENYEEFWKAQSKYIMCSESCKALLQGMLEYDPVKRYTLR